MFTVEELLRQAVDAGPAHEPKRHVSDQELEARPGPIWERLPQETKIAYAAFQTYRMFPKGQRNVLNTYRTYPGHETARNPSGTFQMWCAKYRWVERAFAYDVDQARKIEEAAHAAEEAKAKLYGLEREWYRGKGLDIAKLLLARVETILQWPLAEQRTTQDGKTVILTPVKWRLADIPPMIAAMDKLMRWALGMDELDQKGDLRAQVTRMGEKLGLNRSEIEAAVREAEGIVAGAGDD